MKTNYALKLIGQDKENYEWLRTLNSGIEPTKVEFEKFNAEEKERWNFLKSRYEK